MERNFFSKENKEKFSQKFGHYFRTPLTFRDDKSDIVGDIIRVIMNLGDEPISFVYYWGAGTKSSPGNAEEYFISYLNSFTSEFTDYFGKSPHYEVAILTDTHAKLNEIPDLLWSEYFRKVIDQYQCFNRAFIHSSELWRRGGEDLDKESRIADGISRNEWQEKEISIMLENMASKHYYGPPEKSLLAAKRYFRFNIKEKELVESFYPNYFFISWNSQDLDSILPNKLPILHLHVNELEFDAGKPWFVPNNS